MTSTDSVKMSRAQSAAKAGGRISGRHLTLFDRRICIAPQLRAMGSHGYVDFLRTPAVIRIRNAVSSAVNPKNPRRTT